MCVCVRACMCMKAEEQIRNSDCAHRVAKSSRFFPYCPIESAPLGLHFPRGSHPNHKVYLRHGILG